VRLVARLTAVTIASVAALALVALGIAGGGMSREAAAAAPGYRAYTSQAGGWTAEYPESWSARQLGDPLNAVFTSYDPATASWEQPFGYQRGMSVVPKEHMRINVEVWPNQKRLTAKAYVDEVASQLIDAQLLQRQTVTVGGRTGELLTIREDVPGGARTDLFAYVPSSDGTRIYVIKAWPFDSAQKAQLDHLLTTFSAR
jgi:hypothetical protein